jgi:type III pantothenate kinase
MAIKKLSIDSLLTAIDIGNSFVKIARFDDAHKLSSLKRIKSQGYRGTFSLGNASNIIVSSVVPRLSNKLKIKYPRARFVVQDDLGLKDIPAHLGIDRAVALYAASKLYGPKVLLLDFGTALTFSCLLQYRFKGGLILPGLSLWPRTLARETALLPALESISPAERILETDTLLAMNSGLYHLFTRGIGSLIDGIKLELKQDLTVVATGGFALEWASIIPGVQIINPTLILEGLSLLR